MASFSGTATQPDVNSPHILLMGPPRSGKSSIQRVVFYKMSPHETLFLESTNTLGKIKVLFYLLFCNFKCFLQ
jgi:Holliday junction resolvasome RuvABC ATP-dependent DNA helicase subunit